MLCSARTLLYLQGVPHPGGRDREPHAQAADFKFLRRSRAMTGDVISEMSGDRAAGTHRIPQSTASIQQH